MLKINESILRPESGSELFTQHDLSMACKQQRQNLQRLPVEPDCVSVLAKLLGARIKLKVAKALWQGRLRNFCHDLQGFARSLTPQSAPGKDCVLVLVHMIIGTLESARFVKIPRRPLGRK